MYARSYAIKAMTVCLLIIFILNIPISVEAWNPLKKIRRKAEGALKDAGGAINDALKGDKKNSSSLPQWYLDYLNGLNAKEQEDWETAVTLLKKAIEQEPRAKKWTNKDGTKGGYFPYLHLGLTYLATGDIETARQNCELSKEKGKADQNAIEECLASMTTPPEEEQQAELEPTVTPKPEKQQAELEPTVTPEPVEVTYAVQRPENVYAVIIGIGDYQDERIPPLQYTENDAKGLYDVLTDPNYGGIPKDNIQLLLDEKATMTNIKTAIGRWLSQQAKADDMVIVYYSGHGAPEENDKYWVTYEADIDNLYATALSNNEIFNMLNRVRSNRMVTFLDSCYSAATVNKKNQTRGLLVDIPWEKFSGEGRVTISASDGKQLSLELESYGHGVFTYYLLEGLKGKADGAAGTERDGVVEVEELWNYVKRHVTETARKQGNDQTPVFQGTLAARLPLTYDLDYLEEKRQQEQLEVREKQTKLQQLFEAGTIRADHFDCAFLMLEGGKTNGYLEGLLVDDISPKTFERLFKCEDVQE